jgi:hypothetical protein
VRAFDLAAWGAAVALLLGPALWALDATRLLVAVLVCGVVAVAAPPFAHGEGDGARRERLRRAFERTFEQPGVRRAELRVWRGGRLVARRLFEAAYRRDADTARTLLRFLAPGYLRGHALLVVDDGVGARDTWLYQPSERRPRRVGTAQKGDSFYGSDLTFEDLERPRWGTWHVTAERGGRVGDEPCRVLDAVPPATSQYGLLRVWVAQRLAGVARIDFYRPGARGDADERPVKRLRVDLTDAEPVRGFLRISRVVVTPLGRDARTELAIERMEIDPDLAAAAFSAARLEREGEDLFDWIGPRDGGPAR